MSNLKGAVVGCGFFAQNHLKAWGDVIGADLVAVCDLDSVKVQAAAQLTGASAYTDMAQMLATEQLDFVDIATTMETHLPLTRLAAEAGVNIICQKPFAPDLAGACAIVELAEKACVRVMVHENFRFQEPLRALKARIDGDAIGEPFFAHISWRTGFDVIQGQPYLARTERFLILDLGIHLLDVARFLMGEVNDLYARAQKTHPKAVGEASSIMTLGHRSGAVSEIVCGYTTKINPDPFPQTLVEVEGRDGRLALGIDYQLVHSTRTSRSVIKVPPQAPSWADPDWALAQASVLDTQQHFVDCLKSGDEFQTSGRDNLKTFALVEAAYASSESGRPVIPGDIT